MKDDKSICNHRANYDESVLQEEESSANLQARVMHMAKDHDASILLDEIFDGSDKKSRRETLYNKTTRTPSLWKFLADAYFNNISWTPVNEQEDNRVKHIDPFNAHETPWTPKILLFITQNAVYRV